MGIRGKWTSTLVGQREDARAAVMACHAGATSHRTRQTETEHLKWRDEQAGACRHAHIETGSAVGRRLFERAGERVAADL